MKKILIIGIVASGKTTLAKRLSNQMNFETKLQRYRKKVIRLYDNKNVEELVSSFFI
ncbi:EutP/PduV family microcompartment system protein [Gorillibacterium massiliense]|uniref:EutP/PduV family microcompartment system protein n=1 Tax=Gorillibacterium massiliense TaxID=1280390 RepID=UPI0004AFB7C0|nr:EutP/PduV family microcompartment system protein [Gorillibacterium massiliense]